MSILFFRLHKPWRFSSDTLDIGTWLPSWQRKQLSRFVLKRIFAIGEKRFPEFYHYHLDHYKKTQPDWDEQLFHAYLYELLIEDYNRLKRISIYAKNNVRNEKSKLIEKAAIDYLTNIDQWQAISQSNERTIARQLERIEQLQEQVKTLQEQLKDARKLETEDFINIAAQHRDTVLDLILQMQDLTLPNGKELVLSQTQAAWTKMICKFFREDGEEINLDTIRRYFPADKRSPGRKHAAIAEKHKLFTIKPVRK